jgi:hypothetical protein
MAVLKTDSEFIKKLYVVYEKVTCKIVSESFTLILAKVFASEGHKIKVKTLFFAIKMELLKVLSNFLARS